MKDLNNLTETERVRILARRAYQKAWRERNAEKVRAANERFYKKQAEKLAAEKCGDGDKK